MYGWLKYVAFALIAFLIGCFVGDTVKAARKKGGTWKEIIIQVLIWLLIFAIAIAVNSWINKDWMPGKWFIRIIPF